MTNAQLLSSGLERLLAHKMSQTSVTGWFVYQEIKMGVRSELAARGQDPDAPENAAAVLCECVRRMPLSIPEGSMVAGTQDDAFSPSYALINPAFQVETFAGYCDPMAVYDDIKPSEEFPAERIGRVRSYFADSPYVRNLAGVYESTGAATREVVYFVEPVTGHVIPDFRPILRYGIDELTSLTAAGYAQTMLDSLEAAKILAARYAELADELAERRAADPEEAARLRIIAANCRKVPAGGASNLGEAVQAYVLCWQAMCLEQAPNPYAFSVGNIDRILEPYRDGAEFEEATGWVRCLLAFLMVGKRCWAISQNVLVGGRDADGNDLTTPMSYAALEAFNRSNYPQPALSVRLHRNTPKEFYDCLGKFFFTAGHSTPSIFNDDAMFVLLQKKGIAREDMADYAIAGCQEPLIMGRENANTTNSWLNLGKILELTLNDGKSLITGELLGPSWSEIGYADGEAVAADLENAFFKVLDHHLPRMEAAANGCTRAIGGVPAPFTSAALGCLESGRDARDPEHPGTRYNGSGCLIHGLSVVADSLFAVKAMLEAGVADVATLRQALQRNFQGFETLHGFLLRQDKYGNRIAGVDAIVGRIAEEVAKRVAALRNPSGAPFWPDYSTPSTHLLYGYWVGATPDGREARTMLGYGVDPRTGMATRGLPGRFISNRVLPFGEFTGGYASHYGLDPVWFNDRADREGKMDKMRQTVIDPLFGYNADGDGVAPFYAYFNVDSATSLRKVLADPARYAPSGIYIIRIHGTFVNFLDLSPAIQQDIMERLDPEANKVTA